VQRNIQASTSALPPRQTSRQRVDQIVRQRERLIAEVQDFGAEQGRSESAQKAQQLLTRWWAKADWKAREELLKAAEWLIQMEKQGRA
jgi:shikimate kinase